MEWEDLVMWDNVSFYYTCDRKLSDEELAIIKKTLNSVVNNSYGGHIKKNRVNTHPLICQNKEDRLINYNISTYPSTCPQKLPEYISSILPDEIDVKGTKIRKHEYFAM